MALVRYWRVMAFVFALALVWGLADDHHFRGLWLAIACVVSLFSLSRLLERILR